MNQNYVTKIINPATNLKVKFGNFTNIFVLIIIQLILSGCTSEPAVSTINRVSNDKNNNTQSIFLKGRIYSSPFGSYITLKSGKTVCHSINAEERIKIGKKFTIKCSNGMSGSGVITSRSRNSGEGVLHMSNGFYGGFVFGQNIYQPVKI